MIKLNVTEFCRKQGSMSETEMAKKIKISRSQIWRAKTGAPVGESFISKTVAALPETTFDELFIVED